MREEKIPEGCLRAARKRYRRRQWGHAAVLLLYLAVVAGRPLWALARSARALGERAIPLLLLTALFFAPPVAAYCWYLRRYQRAIRRVAAGELLVLRGEITARRGKRITLRETLPEGLRRSGWQHLTREHHFCLPPGSGEEAPAAGDRVVLWYPADRILWAGRPTAVRVRVLGEKEGEKSSPSL